QPPRHATLATVQHANDDLLTDVATLCLADRPVLNPGFEGNRVLGHVLSEDRPAGLDAAHLDNVRLHVYRSRSSDRLRQGINALDGNPEVEPKPTEIIAAHDRHRRSVPCG